MPSKLTEGAIATIMNGGVVENPVLQVLGYKRIAGSGAERYRVLVSDGRHTHTFAMLATQLNHMVTDGQLENFTVIKVERYVCNMVGGSSGKGDNGKRVMIILALVILDKGATVGTKIGNPQSYSEFGAPAAQQQAQQSPNASGNQGLFKSGPSNTRPYGGGSSSSNYANNDAASQTHPISSLSPYQNRWTIKARVMNKSSIRKYHNQRGEGQLFSMELVDQSGDIRATAFNKQVDDFYDQIEMNKVYFISKCSMKTANKQFTSVKHEYELTFNNETQVIPCDEDDTQIPTITFNFVAIQQLKDMSKDTILDVIGVCKSAGDVQNLTSRTTQRELKKRDLHLVDSSNTEVTLTLWGDDAEKFDGSSRPVVAVKGAKLSDFGGASLSTVFNSILQINPDIRESHVLRGWFDNEGVHMESESISSVKFAGGAGDSNNNIRYFCEVKSQDMGNTERPDYFSSKACITLIKKENALYQACPGTNCNKKVIDQNNGMYRCEKCNCEYHNFKWRLMLQMNIADLTDNVWVSCFQDSAELILGNKSEELGEMQTNDPDKFQAILNEPLFKPMMFRLRVKKESFNDEQRQKTSVMEVSEVNPKEYNKKLLAEIKKLAVV